MKNHLVIGVDFDNTIVTYDELMHKIALEQGLISSSISQSKKLIRDTIRLLPDGEIEWQKLQAIVYGHRMLEAQLIDGVKSFFQLCYQHQIPVSIVSHKTEYANYDPTQTNLRESALKWMEYNHFFSQGKNGLGLKIEQVYFEATRIEKIERIKGLNCTCFIDDLEETFQEPSFPENVQKILYSPHQKHSPIPQVKIINNWQEINDYFFS